MATQTQNLELFKQDGTEYPSLNMFNINMDKIDEAIGEIGNKGSLQSQIDTLGEFVSFDSARSSSTLTKSTSYAIPANVYSHTFLLLQLRRWSYASSVMIEVELLKSDAEQHFRLTSHGGRYWDVTISQAGVITMQDLGGSAGEPYIAVFGLF